MQLATRYEPTTTGSQFVAPVHYLINNGVEYKLTEAVEKLYESNVIDKQIYDKLKDKRTSAQTVALTIKQHLHKL